MLMDDIRTEPAPAPAPCPPAERSAGISILALTSTTCRWPLWEDDARPVNGGLYCGAPVAGMEVYCAACCRAHLRREPRPLAAAAPPRLAQRPSESRKPESGPQPRLSRPVTPRPRPVPAGSDLTAWEERYRAARQRLLQPSAVPAALDGPQQPALEVTPAPGLSPLAPACTDTPDIPAARPAPQIAPQTEKRREKARFEPCPAPPPRAMATPCGSGRALVRMMARHGLGPKVTVEDVLRAVCARYDVARVDLISERRTKGVMLPRQIAMYLARDLTTASLPRIGRIMGGRDHTTILHGCRVIEARLALNPELARDVAALSCTISATAVERAAAERRWGGAE